MSKKVFAALIIVFAAITAAPAQNARRPYPTAAKQKAPWLVSVVHTVELDHLVGRLRKQNQDVRVGVSGTAPQYIFNVVTGLVLDNNGHILTRLANVDPNNPDQRISVITGDGTRLQARLVGVDCASGFAVLQVANLKAPLPKVTAASAIPSGMAVKILSADVKPETAGEGSDQIRITHLIRINEGHIGAQTPSAKLFGTLNLMAEDLLSRSDGSIVTTPEHQVIGIARHRSFGRAYLYPIQTLRDTIAKRVIEKKGSVPAGWLGAKGDSIAELPQSEWESLGLNKKAGVLVREVIPNGPAAIGGVKPNDVIVGLGDFEVTSLKDLSVMLSSSPAGESVRLQVIRERQPLEIAAVLGAREYNGPPPPSFGLDQPGKSLAEQLEDANKRYEEIKAQMIKNNKRPPSIERQEARRELELELYQIFETIRALERKVQEESKKQLSLPAQTYARKYTFAIGFVAFDITPQLGAEWGVRGVFVKSVVAGSPAERAGLTAGDVIVGASQEAPLNCAQLQYIFATRGGIIPLKVVRNKQPITVSVSSQP